MESMTIVYRDKAVMNYLRRKVDEVAHIITDTDKLESRIYSQLADYFSRESVSFRRAQRLINREIDLAFKQFGLQRVVMFSGLSVSTDFGESIEFEPEDVLAHGKRVIESITFNEKIARLATDDRERITLNAWANGFNDMEVSKTLASHFGGNSESHRKFVQRFKAKCQRKLTA